MGGNKFMAHVIEIIIQVFILYIDKKEEHRDNSTLFNMINILLSPTINCMQ